MGLTEGDLPLEEVLQQPPLDILVLLDGFNNEEGKVRIAFILPLPIFEWLQVSFFVHILTALPQLLVVNDVDIGAFLAHVFHPPRIILQSLDDQLLIRLFFEAEGKQGDSLASQEVLHVSTCPFPLLKRCCFQEDALLTIRDVDLVAELSLLHRFEDRYIADGGV